MNLIADEDDMLQAQADALIEAEVEWIAPDAPAEGCVLLPSLGESPAPLLRRAVASILQGMLGVDARIEAASVEAVLAGYRAPGIPNGGYVTNIQGNLAVSANKHGVRIEPMTAFRARRKRG